MATGPAHYRLAEQLTTEAHQAFEDGHFGKHVALTAEAQVHATLALVAATVRLPSDHKAWALAIIGKPTEGPPK